MSEIDDIRLQVMWNRLISVVEEQAMTLLRTAFSTSVREAGDLSAGVFDPEGRMLAQAVTGTPGHVNTMAEAVGHFIAEIPREEMYEGDTYVTNDPWKGTGHLHDITMASPSFLDGRLIGFFACTAHVVDVGGRGFGADGKSVYEEGLQIPIMKFAERGVVNRDLIRILRTNVREPGQVVGDFYSLASCNEVGHRRLVAMMWEIGLSSLDSIRDFIFSRTRTAMRERFRALPKGLWRNEMTTDGYDEPILLAVAVDIREETIHVDFAGSAPVSRWGINVPMIYGKAYASYALKCVVAPEIPNNWASLAPFRMKIPEGCILNAPHPYPVSVRHVIGHLLPDLMMGCLHQAVPERVTAEGASALWNPPLRGGGAISGQARGNKPVIADFEIITFNSGGTGARPARDGLNATAFPSGVRTMPVEATENVAPIVLWRKELKPDSGGAGRTRGGVGQIMEIATKGDLEFAVNASFDRIAHAPKGREGGLDGATGRVAHKSGTKLRTKGFQVIPDGERLALHLPGGGGMGDPAMRDPTLVAADVRDGLVSPASAERDYRVALAPDGVVDEAATARLRRRS